LHDAVVRIQIYKTPGILNKIKKSKIYSRSTNNLYHINCDHSFMAYDLAFDHDLILWVKIYNDYTLMVYEAVH